MEKKEAMIAKKEKDFMDEIYWDIICFAPTKWWEFTVIGVILLISIIAMCHAI